MTGTFEGILVVIDEVATAENDDLLGAFGTRPIQSPEVRRWWCEHVLGSMRD